MAAGITVIVSAGNHGRNGYMTVNSPGNDPYVLTVGAMNDRGSMTREDDVVTTFTGRGPSFGDHVLKPDLVAPGNRIVSTLAPGATLQQIVPEQVVDRRSIELSGSSMATGMVTGVAALMLEKNPKLTPDQIKTGSCTRGSRMLMPTSSPSEPDTSMPFARSSTHSRGRRLADSSSPLVVRTDDGFSSPTPRSSARIASDTALWGDTALWATPHSGATPRSKGHRAWGDTSSGVTPRSGRHRAPG